ncbi:alpha/beta hydrolase [Mesobacillus subterraneus]|uniref:alpha/beta hydrolase n=1 Tax=Mesobacillus subterraneus TaxID=285983 RepID=UPI00203BC36C|nr:alpha/beta hydrolase [Mesobacillus subterraneus]MCM3665379.1 alpha/beta hydrolase [Mesobacillus subterraneus]MCM3684613.1 alpha/beta hydrolase [Mesobacillus subterraneus]
MRKTFRVLFSFLLVLASLGVYISNKLMFLKKKADEEILTRETEAGHLIPDEYEALPKREVTIPSSFGYQLKAVLVEPHDTNRYIIIAHGVTQSKTNSVKYMNLFLNRGYNAVIYDHRRHGESGGKTTSYGYYEKFDLKSVVDWLREEKGADLFLGIHGESMGAATLLLYAGMLEDGADFYVADCPFSDFSEQLAYRIKEEVKLLPPRLLLPVASLFLRIRDKYSLNDVSPISVIENINNPILFIHSRKDDFILPSMTEALFEQKKGPKKLYMAENGHHAQSYSQNRQEYEKVLDEFLEEHVFAADQDAEDIVLET